MYLKLTSFISVLVLFAVALPQMQGQIESPFDKGAYGIGIGNAAAGNAGHYGILYNQAGIAGLKDMSVSVDGGRIFSDSELLHLHLGAVIPTKRQGVFGIRIQRYGLEGYNYQNYAFTYARILFNNFQIAATFNYYQFQIENYGNTFIPNLEIGALSRLTDRLSLGVHLANPLPLEIADQTDFPTVLSAGLKYQVSPLIYINLDVEKNIRERENVKVGINYSIHPRLDLRVGVNSFPGSFHFGFAVKTDRLNVNFGNAFHPILGNSTGVGIVYQNTPRPAEAEVKF